MFVEINEYYTGIEENNNKIEDIKKTIQELKNVNHYMIYQIKRNRTEIMKLEKIFFNEGKSK